MHIDWPDPRAAPDDLDLVAISARTLQGASLYVDRPWPALTEYGSSWDPDVLISAYRHGLFPMPLDDTGDDDAIGWWSPAERAVFLPGEVRVSKSTRTAMRGFSFTVDTCLRDVIERCGDPNRPQGWIDEHVIEAFTTLHERGYVHSVEVWASGSLVGGLYGVQVGGVFAGESMFHSQANASKAALAVLAGVIPDCIIDTQWLTDHLTSLGARAIGRTAYLRELAARRDEPAPIWPTGLVVT